MEQTNCVPLKEVAAFRGCPLTEVHCSFAPCESAWGVVHPLNPPFLFLLLPQLCEGICWVSCVSIVHCVSTNGEEPLYSRHTVNCETVANTEGPLYSRHTVNCETVANTKGPLYSRHTVNCETVANTEGPLYNGHFGNFKTVCYRGVSTLERLFHIHNNLYLDPQKQSVIERFSLLGEFVIERFPLLGESVIERFPLLGEFVIERFPLLGEFVIERFSLLGEFAIRGSSLSCDYASQ